MFNKFGILSQDVLAIQLTSQISLLSVELMVLETNVYPKVEERIQQENWNRKEIIKALLKECERQLEELLKNEEENTTTEGEGND